MTSATYLGLIELVDSFPYASDAPDQYYKLILPNSFKEQGWMHPNIVNKIPWTNHFRVSHAQRIICVDQSIPQDQLPTIVTKLFAELVNLIIDGNVFKCTGKRHSELFIVPGCAYDVRLERFTTSLFGVTTRGAHLTAYTRDSAGQYKFWVARRSMNVGHFKGMLDSTVAGGVAADETPFENIVREAAEEASLDAAFVRESIVPAGMLTYMGLSKGENGWEEGMVLPDMVCVYDMLLDEQTVPQPCDDEVKDFRLLTLEEVRASMLAREWKPNSAVIMLDFFIRHGLVTYENEADYVEICQRMHRRLPFL